jgi:hypothetical protein
VTNLCRFGAKLGLSLARVVDLLAIFNREAHCTAEDVFNERLMGLARIIGAEAVEKNKLLVLPFLGRVSTARLKCAGRIKLRARHSELSLVGHCIFGCQCST